jgi:hypothetical protein
VNIASASRLLFFAVSFSPVLAQTPTPIVTPGAVDGNGAPTSGAKLCSSAIPTACFTMPDLKSDGTDYQFGLQPQARVLVDDAKRPLFLFEARYSDGNKAVLTRYVVLEQTGPRIVTQLPPVDITNFGDIEVWSDPSSSKYPTIVSADFIWDTDGGEQRTDPHRFNISVWRYRPSSHRYTLALTYKTDAKYAVMPTAIGVVDKERQNILDRLEPKRGKH